MFSFYIVLISSFSLGYFAGWNKLSNLLHIPPIVIIFLLRYIYNVANNVFDCAIRFVCNDTAETYHPIVAVLDCVVNKNALS